MDQQKEQGRKKTTEELYLERLKKWKEQKVLKEKTSNDKMSASIKIRKPQTKDDHRTQKNTKQDRNGGTFKENTGKQKTHSSKNSIQVNKKPSMKCREVKSRLLDIPCRLMAPPRRSELTSKVVADKASTTRNVGKQSMHTAPLKTSKPLKLSAIGLKTNVSNNHHRSNCGSRRSSLTTTRGRLVKGITCGKQPHSILKRKSCVPYLSSQCEDSSKNSPEVQGLTHVKFRSLNCSHENVNSKYRKTPVRSQESLRKQLNSWLTAKGKTPSRFRHLMCFDAEMSAKKDQDSRSKQSLTVDELSQQQDTLAKEENICVNLESTVLCSAESDESNLSADIQLNTMLTQCQTLLESGCPSECILAWLQNIHDNIPVAAKSTQFYLLKVAVLKPMGDLDPVLATFEDAIANSSQPPDELARAMSLTIREMTDAMVKTNMKQPGTNKSAKCVSDDNMFESTAVKYYVQEVSDFKKRRTTLYECETPQSARAVITPVRRSTRRSMPAKSDLKQLLHTPANSKMGLSVERPKLYNSLADVPEAEKDSLLYRPNEVMKALLFS